jgi:hypothetical protein
MAIVIKNNYLIPIIRINDKESGGAILNIPTEEYISKLKAGIDTTQFSGIVTFDHVNQEVRIENGRIFIVDLASAIAMLGDYLQIEIDGMGYNNHDRGYINGREIRKGRGTSYNVYNRNDFLREGWNDVQMGAGYIKIRGPFLTEIQ